MQWIKIDLLNVEIAFCRNNKEYQKVIKTNKLEKTPLFNSRGLTIRFDDELNKMSLIVIIVDETLDTIEELDTIVHEASHATTMIMKYFKIKDDEFRSYLLGYICNKIYKHLYDEND